MWSLVPEERSRIGGYDVHCEIGRGGMGAVYLASSARADGFHKLVALKTVPPNLEAGPRFARMLLDEARIASRLQHPHIVQLYDLGLEGPLPYLVMEYVHGESLASILLETQRLPDPLAIWLAMEICDALVYAHGLGSSDGRPLELVHRDVSPHNILVSYDGVPKLVDFGIARASDRLTQTEDGVVKGRIAYMPPEQRLGLEVDGRADLFALGMVLYEATVGRHPWKDGRCGVAAYEDPLPPPFAIRPEYPPELWRVIDRATQPDREARFPNAEEMLRALRASAKSLGEAVDRQQMAAFTRDRFDERRLAKERLITDRDTAGDRTEALETASPAPGPRRAIADVAAASPAAPRSKDTTAPTAAGSRARHRRRGPAILDAAIVLSAAGIVLFSRGGGDLPPARTAVGSAAAPSPVRVCLLVSPGVLLDRREATWALAQSIGRSLDRSPTVVPVHGYRAQERFGWTADGIDRARAACREARAGAVVTLSIQQDGGATMTVEVGGDSLSPEHAPADALVRMGGRLGSRMVQLLGGAPWNPDLPDLDDASLIRALRVRDHFSLEHNYPSMRRHLDAAIRERPDTEEPYLVEALARWIAGDLDRPDRGALRRPANASVGLDRLLGAIDALVAGRHDDAARLAFAVIEDRRHRDDPLALYVVGETLFHGHRPGEGARYFERALALDPELLPAGRHLFERRLAEGDWSGLEALADLWQRADPSDGHRLEIRAHAALGAGRHRDAADLFTRLMDETGSDSADLFLANVGLLYSLALAGNVAGALAQAERISEGSAELLPIASGIPDPIAYALVLWQRDDTATARWTRRVATKLGDDEWVTANQHQLGYMMAILDQLAGRRGARKRWLAHAARGPVPRSYRYEQQARFFEILEARASGSAGVLEQLEAATESPVVANVAAGLRAELQGDLDGAARHLEAALASTAQGELDCIVLAALARVQRLRGDGQAAKASCKRVLAPHVPRAYCIVLWPECGKPADRD